MRLGDEFGAGGRESIEVSARCPVSFLPFVGAALFSLERRLLQVLVDEEPEFPHEVQEAVADLASGGRLVEPAFQDSLQVNAQRAGGVAGRGDAMALQLDDERSDPDFSSECNTQ